MFTRLEPWPVAAVAAAVLAVVHGVFGSVGVLIDPLAAEWGAPRAQVALLFASALAVHTVVARPAGRLLDGHGPRPLLVLAAVGMAAGLLAPATAGAAWVAVCGYGAGLGVASACTWVATTGVVSATFRRRRAAALGLLTAGPAAGGAVLAPTITALTGLHGPRPTCVGLAAFGVVACGVGAVLLGGHGAPGRAVVERGTGVRETAPRWVLVTGLVMGLVVFVPLVHLAGAATRLGLSPGHGAALLTVVSAVSAATRVGAGWLATPAVLPSLYRAAHVLVAAAFGTWTLATPTTAFPVLLVGAVVFGSGYGAWLSLGPAVLAATCPPGRLGRALGSLGSAVGVGGVAGPIIAGTLLDTAPTVLLVGCTVTALAAASALPSPSTPSSLERQKDHAR